MEIVNTIIEISEDSRIKTTLENLEEVKIIAKNLVIEKVARYCSETYKTRVSTIDAEILACIYVLENFKIFLISQNGFTLWTDYQAIVKFYNTINDKKLSNNRWLKFIDFLIGNGYKVKIEHFQGKDNFLADKLSRIVTTSLENY